MDIFIDSANIVEVEKWLEMGVIDGVTTNPTIMFNDGVYDAETGAKKIAALVDPKPVCVEVTTNDLDQMLVQAHQFASWAANIVVKIPHITQDGVPCYSVIKQLESEGIKVNATAALSLGQVMLAAKTGATYVSSIKKTRKSSLFGRNTESAKRVTPLSRKRRLSPPERIFDKISFLFKISHRTQSPKTPQ